ncbi:MAG: hypothetical protein ACM3TN_15035, partial [Alphaproteobacteria bacterium]
MLSEVCELGRLDVQHPLATTNRYPFVSSTFQNTRMLVILRERFATVGAGFSFYPISLFYHG